MKGKGEGEGGVGGHACTIIDGWVQGRDRVRVKVMLGKVRVPCVSPVVHLVMNAASVAVLGVAPSPMAMQTHPRMRSAFFAPFELPLLIPCRTAA